MKIGIYTPYLDSLGGGERYMMTIAEILSSESSVDVFLDSHLIKLDISKLSYSLSKRFNLNLKKINYIKAPIGKGSNFLSRLFFLKKYDYFFDLTDGSIFFSTAKNNILHFQTPFHNDSLGSIWGNIKLSTWNSVIYNSDFTKNWVEKSWPLKGKVIYPPVDTDMIKPLKKEKVILNVGRFVSFSKSKKHEEMINAFIGLVETGKIRGWKLFLVGSTEGDPDYVNDLKKLAGGYPIFFYPNLEFQELVKIYGKAQIYWHAAGYMENDPAKMEHFGITTVEAMTGGAVPVVINSGGQPEILEGGKFGYLWNSIDELKSMTLDLINNQKIIRQMSNLAIERSHFFSKERFKQEILDLVSKDGK